VLGEYAAGKRRVRPKLLATGVAVGIEPVPKIFRADDAVSLGDCDGSGVPELPLIGETASDSARIQAGDAASGSTLFKVTRR
jgi:hypothetical protein